MSDSFRDRAEAVLPLPVFEILEAVEAIGRELERPLWVVGGLVRDVLLNRPTADLDLVATGDVGRAVAVLTERFAADEAKASRFGTYRWQLASGHRVDLATARRESYARPGTLPTVEPGDLNEDLARRDFSINAMAVELAGDWGEVVDPTGGLEDLAAGTLRTLHAGSFVDDPTRIFRGLELAARLGFELETATAGQAVEALAAGALDTLSPARLEAAFERFAKPPARTLEARVREAQQLGVWLAMVPGWSFDAGTMARVGRLAGAGLAYAGGRQLARTLVWDEPDRAAALARRFAAGPRVRERWVDFAERHAALVRRLATLTTAPRPSRSLALLDPFDDAERELLVLVGEPSVAKLVTGAREQARRPPLQITGRDLLAAGFDPGPAVGRALEETRRALLDGEITAGEEFEYACRSLRRIGEAGADS